MAIDIELDMRVDPDNEVTMSVEDGDEVSFDVGEAIVVKDHAILDNRDLPDQHPISAITGLAEALAESGKIDTVKVNGTPLPVVNKAVDVPVPVQSVNGMTGDVVVSGLPSATEDGTALVYVDGEWTEQTGYGYYKPEPTDVVYTFMKTTTAFQPTLLTFGVSLTEGEPYRVVYDGVIYDLECITRVVTFEGTTVTVQMVGNAQLIGSTGGNPNCPFALVSALLPDPDEGTTIITWDIIITSTSGDHQGRLLKYQPTAHPIDNSYINITSSQVTDALGYTPVSTSNLTAFMRKGVDYVTAGRKSGTTEGVHSTAEGYNNTASGNYSHAEGYSTFALYYHTHAEGQYSMAGGLNSHAEGTYTVADRKSQHVFGEYNIREGGNAQSRGTYVEIVGNGTDVDARSNARTLDWSGNEVLAGTLTVGADPTANMQVATKQYVDNSVVTPPVTSVNGRTGAVTGLAEASAIPTKTSDLTNDSGFVTHDNQVEQSYISNPSSYTYWRGLAIGASAVASESGALSTTTDKVYVADAIRVQPSTGTIKATTFKGNLTGTASGNLVSSDLVAITTTEIDALFV